MVMVANRKTQEQMAEDLSLFLSNNTIKFTTWFVVSVLVLTVFANKRYLLSSVFDATFNHF